MCVQPPPGKEQVLYTHMTLIFVTLWIFLHCPLSPISYSWSQNLYLRANPLVSENMPCSSSWVWVSLLWINFSSSKFHDALLKSCVLWQYVNLTHFCLFFGWGISRLLLVSGCYAVSCKEHGWANVLGHNCRIFWCMLRRGMAGYWVADGQGYCRSLPWMEEQAHPFLEVLTSVNCHFCFWS